LGCDREEKLAALADFAFDPHTSTHKSNEALRNGQP
jgi:hypothetical protein